MTSQPGPSPAVRVLVATPLGLGGRGGIDRIMDDLRRQLVKDGGHGVDVRFTTTRGQGHIALSPLHLAASLAAAVGSRIMRRADVLHVNLSSAGSTTRKLLLCRAARAVGLPYVVHLHGSRFRQFFDGADASKKAAIAAMFAGAARVIVLGQVWKDFLVERLPALASRVEIVPNASPTPKARGMPPGADPHILFLGQLGARKGVPQLVEALAQLKDLPGWSATIAGNGDVAAVRAAVSAQGLEGRVAVADWLGPAEVEELLSRGHVLALPSFDENLPMSVIEGMAHGLAVVATPVGAVEDIVQHETTGLIVPVGDVAALAAALARLVRDEALREHLGAQAAAFHRDHLEMGAYLQRLAAIWRAAAASRPA